jgi:sensor histidine kinase YesM
MNSKKIVDFGLPFPWNIHARILVSGIIGSLIFWLISKNSNFLQPFIVGIIIMLLDGEIIYWISRALFNSIKSGSPREVTFQIIWRVVVFLLVILLVGTTVASLAILGMNMYNGNSFTDSINIIRHFELKGIVVSLVFASILATMAFFFMIWQEAMKSAFKAREEMLIYQSETLKNQVNPHFLFNSLNTLSSLIPTNPERAELFTQKLSVIYRYILENRDAETVPLSQEIGFVSDYYFLQKIRDEEKIELTINIQNPEYRILPVSLQLLVENAFKHNAATRESPLFVSITQKNSWIEVRNNLQPRKQLKPSTGLGLKNLSERIRLQSGKTLIIEKNDQEFIVRMPLII